MYSHLNHGAWTFTLAQTNGGGTVVMPGNPAQQGNATAPAQTGQPNGGATNAPQPAPAFSGTFLFIIMAFVAIMIFSSVMSGRRERKRRAELLGSLAKHDKVQTIGGVIGKIVEIRDDEVILKVDENSNTRVTFARSAIQQVLKSSGAAPETPEKV